MTQGTWISIFHFQTASPSWRCRKMQATTPRVLEIDHHNHIYSETTWHRVLRLVYFISKGHLPPEGAGKCEPPLLGFGDRPHNYIYILKLNDPGYLDKYISFPKGRLPPEGARKSKPPLLGVLEIDPITIYILKLHDPGYLGKYISFPKGISLLKVQEKQAIRKLKVWV